MLWRIEMLLGIEISLIGKLLITLNNLFSLIVKDISIAKVIGWSFVVEIASQMLTNFFTISLMIREFVMKLSSDWWSFPTGVILLQKSFLIL